MILYYTPGACSLADHIALEEAGLSYDLAKVDLKSHQTDDGSDYYAINPKGYVPALRLDGGETLTENLAILSWIADQAGAAASGGGMGRYRLLETLAYISTEIHKAFKPFFRPGSSDADKAEAGAAIGKRLALLAPRLEGGFLMGPEPSVADAYLFVMLRWAKANGIALSAPLSSFFQRMGERPAVRRALEQEGLA